MRLESGPAKTDGLWKIGFTILCIGFTVWFYMDGTKWWPESNRAQARAYFSNIGSKATEFGTRPSKEDFDAALRAGVTDIDGLRQRFGEPEYTASAGTEQVAYFGSDYGYAEIRIGTGGRVTLAPSQWHDWEHTKAQIDGQLYWAAIPAVFAIICALQAYRAFSLRVVIDGDGMAYAGKVIPMSAIQSLRDFSPKGLVSLYYDEGGRERKLRLDNQKVEKFDEIIVAICAARGFDDPRSHDEDNEPVDESAAQRPDQAAGE